MRNAWFAGAILIAALAMGVALPHAIAQPAPTPPTSQGRIVTVPVDPRRISADDILQGACDVANEVADDLKQERTVNQKLRSDFQTLYGLVCRKF